MLQTLGMRIERHEKYLLQILKIDKFGNYLVADPLKLLLICYNKKKLAAYNTAQK